MMNYGLHPTVLDLVVVVGDYRVELTWGLSLRSTGFVFCNGRPAALWSVSEILNVSRELQRGGHG